MFNFLESNSFQRVANATGLSYNDISSARIDMQAESAEGVTFAAALGAVETGSVLTLQVWEHTADAAAGTQIDDAEVTFTAGASDADNNMLLITVHKDAISKRYVYAKLVVETAQAAVDGIFAIAHCPRTFPVTQGSAVIASATLEANTAD